MRPERADVYGHPSRALQPLVLPLPVSHHERRNRWLQLL